MLNCDDIAAWEDFSNIGKESNTNYRKQKEALLTRQPLLKQEQILTGTVYIPVNLVGYSRINFVLIVGL